jgi:UPF0176 protein
MRPKDYQILLYYRFIPVDDPAALRDDQEALCRRLNLLGRILVAKEGINGTVSGLKADTEAYMEAMRNDPRFPGIEFKVDAHHEHAFLKLHVRVKEEIVHLGAGELEVPATATNYIEPDEWREMLANPPEDAVILDARSIYETEVGRFKGALSLDIGNFRDLPDALKQAEEKLKGKTIYTYCTGGIKCEKVSVLLKQLGHEKVYQLHGGIVRYAHETGGEGFEGQCYVFDQRVVAPVNQVDPVTVGKCHLCEQPAESMINCANPDCNLHFLICDECAVRMEGTCSDACHAHPRRRMFDGRGYYLRGVNSKLYAQNPDPNYLRLVAAKQR